MSFISLFKLDSVVVPESCIFFSIPVCIADAATIIPNDAATIIPNGATVIPDVTATFINRPAIY